MQAGTRSVAAPAMNSSSDSIWLALRRRKVAQWGIAYAAGAWVLLQVLEYVQESFDWPGELRQIGILVLLTGLPLALLVAWFHGDRGEQRVTGVELALIAAVCVLGGGVLWHYGPRVERAASRQATVVSYAVSGAATRDARPSVAVLAFTNLTADPANDYLADGIAETLTTMLAQVRDLNVIGPAQSFSLKGQSEDARVLGAKLGAGALLAGSVQRVDSRIRVAAQLVSTTDGTQLWAAIYDQPELDIFAVQDAIATEVTRALSIALAGNAGVGAIGTQDVAAYDLYLRGKQLIERRVSGSIEDGIAALERSVDRDPTFARAWAELARGYLLIATDATGATDSGSRSTAPSRERARRAAQRAVKIAPSLGAGHAALAEYLSATGQETAALTAAVKAAQLSPDDAWCLSVLAGTLRDAGQPEAAVGPTQRALQVDPSNWRLRLSAGRTFEALGDRSGALRQYREAIRLEPDFAATYLLVGQSLSDMVGQTDMALRFLRKARNLDPDHTDTQRALLAGYMRIGHRKFAKQLLRSANRRASGADHHLALEVHAYLDGSQVWPGTDRQQACRLSASQPPGWRMSNAGPAPRNHRGRHAGTTATAAPASPRMGLARNHVCAGDVEAAIDEFDRLLAQGFGLQGWRDLAADPAYETLREHPGFKAIMTHLKVVADGELKRFNARPDLTESDIEALGHRIDLADRRHVVTRANRSQPESTLTGSTRKTPTRP
jgi:TolB-like protein/Flp pilus assembly protein TadD